MTPPFQNTDSSTPRAIGHAIAASLTSTGDHGGRIKRRVRAVRRAIYAGLDTRDASRLHQDWLAGNARLIVATERDLETFAREAERLPAALAAGAAAPALRIEILAHAYLREIGRFDDERFVAFLGGVQEILELDMSEVWAAKPVLLLALLEQVVEAAAAAREHLPRAITNLRAVSEARWKDVFERVNVVDPVLAADPACAYAWMDDDSRELYRRAVAELARHSPLGERQVAESAITLARQASVAGLESRATLRRAHVGYYLIDDGLPRLRALIGYTAPPSIRIAGALLAWPMASYMAGLALVTAAIVSGLYALLGSEPAALAGLALLLLPASQAATELVAQLVTSVLPPRRLPKLDFSIAGIPDEHATLVAIPSLLLNEAHVRQLVADLEIRYLANRDPNLSFALVTNSRDARQRQHDEDAGLRLCEQLVTALNDRYANGGRTPFYLLHRRLAYYPSDGLWIGWERKRGKLLDLNQLLRGARDRFPVKVGDIGALARIQYVITLDSDTELPRDAARKLVGAIAHPLNRAVLDPVTSTVVEGYGILQPRISISTHSTSRSWLANLYSGESGFDIYTRAVSDVYQDLFGEGNFTGKGVYEVDTFRAALEHRFPVNTLLSHDLIEGVFARAGLVSDVELVDDYPSHFSAYSRRRHRWMRGDWQILRWLLPSVPDGRGRHVSNPLSAVSRWKILDNLRRSLLEPAALVLLLAAWLGMPQFAAIWTAALVGVRLLPAYARFVAALPNAPWRAHAAGAWFKAAFAELARTHLVVALHLTYLLHDALLAFDAILRSLARMFVTRRRLLEWETAAEAALRARGTIDVYLERSPYIAAGLAGLVAWAQPDALPEAAAVLALWVSSRVVKRWLNRPPRADDHRLDARDERFVRDHALRTWRFFSTFSTSRVHWLIPDFVRADGTSADRLTPTNLGFLLNARVAAVHFGYLTLPEFAAQTRHTLEAVSTLPRHRGHLLNWYDATTLGTLDPHFVSTVDSGNLAAALWSLASAAEIWAAEPPASELLRDGLLDVLGAIGDGGQADGYALRSRLIDAGRHWPLLLPSIEGAAAHLIANAEGDASCWPQELVARVRHARAWLAVGFSSALRRELLQIAATAHALAAAMDFSFLYDARRKVLSVGFDVRTGRLERSTYDLLASEARIASFVAIAKGDIPQESWLHLGRAHVAAQGQRVLLSWTGTLFEYIMPALWFRHRPGTIMRQSMRAAVSVQRRFARARGVPWGFSESAHIITGSNEYGYAPCGLPELALKPAGRETGGHDAIVVSPYSTYLALLVDDRAALENLRRLAQNGAVGAYGFYEAVDYSSERPQMVESWMAHHQGMILMASAERLFGNPFQRAFHRNPYVRATERLLDERVPRTIVADAEARPRLLLPEESVA